MMKKNGRCYYDDDEDYDIVRDIMLSNCDSEDEYQEAYGDIMNSLGDD